MSNRPTTKSRNKKVPGTTLGKAPSYTIDEPIDLSHVRKPIETSLFGLSQVLRLFETATEEVRSYVAYECDLIYECRLCRTLFRSLANFILHKRSYCTDSYRSSSHARFREDEMGQDINFVDGDDSRTNSPINLDHTEGTELSSNNSTQGEARRKKDLNAVLNHLYDKQESSFITEQCLLEDVSNESHHSEEDNIKNNIALQKLNNSNAGVFQTMFSQLKKTSKMDFMKTEVMEIHNILESNEAILGSDGKIVVSESEKNSILKNNYTCSMCHQKFSTKKTLTYHIRYKHNNSRLVYPCTECKETFANTWCVFRHLYKVHQKSTTQVRKLRNLIHDSAIKRGNAVERRCNVALRSGSSLEVQEKTNLDDQQWMDNLEKDNDLQRCGGCGRKFERKAALHSHSQFCAKRIAVCNSLKENIGKKNQTEEKHDKFSKASKNSVVYTEPVRRRKPLVAQKIERFKYCNDISILEEMIGPLPNRNSSPCKNNSENNINSCQMRVEHLPEDNLLDNKSDILSEGSGAVDQHNDNIKAVPLDVESKVDEKQAVQNDLHDTLEETCISEPESSKSTMVEIGDSSNKCIEEIREDSTDLPVKTCDININSHNDSEPEGMVCDNFTAEASNQKSNADLISLTKLKSSLAKKSLQYVDIEKQICIPCKKRFNTYKSLMKHMALHFNWCRYHCSICKYCSYTKSKCKHHVISKHNILDKVRLSSSVRRISHSKRRENATNFVKHYKRKKVSQIKTIKEDTSNKIETRENLIGLNTDTCDDKTIQNNIQDPLVRQMVMEVIFGTSPAVSEKFSVNICQDDDVSESSMNDLEIENELFETKAQQNSVTPQVPLKLDTHKPQFVERPVRTRIMPVHKDFLYDMKHVLKIKRSEDSKLKRKVKLRSQSVTHSAMKIEKVPSSASNKNKSDNSISCIQVINIKTNDIGAKHVTGDLM